MDLAYLRIKDSEQKAELRKEESQVLKIKNQFQDFRFYEQISELQNLYFENKVQRVLYYSQKRERQFSHILNVEIK